MTEMANEYWNSYWKVNSSQTTFDSYSPSDKVLHKEWVDFFIKFTKCDFKMIDLCCGKGVVTRLARNLLPELPLKYHCVDHSPSAINSIKNEFPEINAFIDNVENLPFEDNLFDLVVSQFGIEYAGINGIKEALRILSHRGNIMLIMHIKDGKIYQESKKNLELFNIFYESGFFALSLDVFKAGYEISTSNGNSSTFKMADIKLSKINSEIKPKLISLCRDGYGHNFIKIYQDIAYMYSNMEDYKAEDVYRWFDKIEQELLAFSGRSKAMIEAAMSKEFLNKIRILFDRNNLQLVGDKTLSAGEDGNQFAHLFIATKK